MFKSNLSIDQKKDLIITEDKSIRDALIKINKNLQKCVTYDCSINTSSITCSGSGVDNYCRWDNTTNKCVIDRSTRQCQSFGKNRCQNSETCTWSNDMCYDNDRSDCSYNNNYKLFF